MALTTEAAAAEWVDALALGRLTKMVGPDPKRLGLEIADYREKNTTLPTRFEYLVTMVVFVDMAMADEDDGMDLMVDYPDISVSGIKQEVRRRLDGSIKLANLADAMQLHEAGDDVAAIETIRSKILTPS